MTKRDWVIRVAGVNFDDTVYNTNDLSTIRGSSLVLEAVGFQLELRLKQYQRWKILTDQNSKWLFRGGSACAAHFLGWTEAEIAVIADRVRWYLNSRRFALTGDPPYVDWEKIEKAGGWGNVTSVAWLHYLKTPSEHMTFVVDVAPVESGDVGAAVNLAHQRNRRRQMRAPNLPRSPAARATGTGGLARLVCPVDTDQQIALLPDGTEDERARVWARRGQFPDPYVRAKDGGLRLFQMSERSADLRTYGRDARRTLYPVMLGPKKATDLHKAGLFDTHDLAQSFADIVGGPPPDLPVSLEGKLAFAYFDGNGFGGIRAGNPIGAFAEAVEEARCAAMGELLDFFLEKPLSKERTYRRRVMVREPGSKAMTDRTRELLRMETLIAGGEDFSLVLPAWLAWDVTWKMLRWLDDAGRAAVAKHKLTARDGLSYRAGLVICHAKTPARRATAFANALCDDAKKVRKGSGTLSEAALSCHVVESHDVPDLPAQGGRPLDQIRRDALRSSDADPKDTDYGAPFRFTMDNRDRLDDDLAWFKERFPRSQLYNLIEDHADLDEALTNMAQRGRAGTSARELKERLRIDDPARAHLRLKQLAELWDYVHPFRRMAGAAEDAA